MGHFYLGHPVGWSFTFVSLNTYCCSACSECSTADVNVAAQERAVVANGAHGRALVVVDTCQIPHHHYDQQTTEIITNNIRNHL